MALQHSAQMAEQTRKRQVRSPQPKTAFRPAHRSLLKQTWLGLSAILLIFCGLAGFLGTLTGAVLFRASSSVRYEIVETNRPFYAGSPVGPDAAVSPLSAVFTPEIQYWAPLIKAWAVKYQVDPNLIATVLQIESCGDPFVTSSAGAQGLFQVMPFHFEAGEDMLDVQTNAQRGLDYLLGGLDRSDGHVGLALAGYNGGHSVIQRGWAAWLPETRRYYYWGARIYSEAISGMAASPTLEEWLAAGGSSLCARANDSEKTIESQAGLPTG
jgi:soluble lytic murein transglycosylase-like protein